MTGEVARIWPALGTDVFSLLSAAKGCFGRGAQTAVLGQWVPHFVQLSWELGGGDASALGLLGETGRISPFLKL